MNSASTALRGIAARADPESSSPHTRSANRWICPALSRRGQALRCSCCMLLISSDSFPTARRTRSKKSQPRLLPVNAPVPGDLQQFRSGRVHPGRLVLAAVEGRFRLLVPRSRARHSRPSRADSTVPPGRLARQVLQGGATIPREHTMNAATGCLLIVDDDEPGREGLARRLRRQGYEVCCAPGGPEALEVLG